MQPAFARSSPDESVNSKSPALQVVLAFEELCFAARAVELVNRIGQSDGGPEWTSCHLVRLETFGNPVAAQHLLSRSLEADAIVVSAASLDSLSPEVHSWLAEWIARRTKTTAFVLLLELDENSKRAGLLEIAKLAGATCHGEVKLFACDAHDRLQRVACEGEVADTAYIASPVGDSRGPSPN
jgi:hypothetical protein